MCNNALDADLSSIISACGVWSENCLLGASISLVQQQLKKKTEKNENSFSKFKIYKKTTLHREK